MAGPVDDMYEGMTPIRASASVGSTPVPGMASPATPVAPPAAPAPKAATVAMPAPGEAYTANAPEVEPDLYEGMRPIRPGDPRQAEGAVEHLKAGLQGSVYAHMVRQKLPDLISDPALSSWWERLITGTAQVAADLPIMIPAGIKGGAMGAAMGAAVSGPAAPLGAAIGGTLMGGAAMFGVPAAMRQTLVEAYKAREATTPQDYWQMLRNVAAAGAHEGAIGAVTMGAGALAARAVGAALVPAIGKSMTVGTATKTIGAADVGAQIAAMVSMPAALEGRLPEFREFGDAAAVILTLKAGHMVVDRAARSRVAARVADNFVKTGKTPAEQVTDAQANPKLADALTAPEMGPFPPQVEIRSQMGLFNPKPVEGEIAPDGTRVEAAKPENATGTPEIAPPVAQSPEVAAQVAELARARLAELDAKAKGTQDATAQTPDGPVKIPGKPAEILTDAEKAERSFLTHNADNPEVVAKRYNIVTPDRRVYTIEERTASEERVMEDVRRKLADADAMRRSVGEVPLGDEHAAAVATLVRRQVNTFAEMHGVLPEDIYREMYLGIKNLKEPGAAAAQDPAMAAKLAELKAAHDAKVDLINRTTELSADEKGSRLKGAGMQYAAEVRRATGDLTPREQAAKDAREAGNYIGKSVIVDGKPAKVTANPFGKVSVEFEDGTKKTVEKESVQPAPAEDATLRVILPPEVDMFGDPIDPPKPDHTVGDLPVVQLPVASLKLSTEVRQFKKDASTESGVVEPLKGKPDPTGWAIQVWERLNGDLEVISGRHRLDLWRRNSLENIPAQVHREADGFDAKKAAMLDAELNIRDEQGSVADYVQYFRSSEMDRETADARGLLDRAKGRSGFSIARDASPVLLDAHRAGLLTDDAALALSAAAPGSERLQALGMSVVNDGKSILMATNMMRSVELMAAERAAAGEQGDMFGFDDSAMRQAEEMAKRASARQRKISEQISAVSGASKRPEIARSMGVDVRDPEGIQKRIAELKAEQHQWDNWPLYPELVAKLRGEELMQANQAGVSPEVAYTEGQEARNEQSGNDAGRPTGEPERAYRNVTGGTPDPQWAAATRARKSSGTLVTVYRGSDSRLSADSFEPERLAGSSGRAKAAIGVWFSSSRSEATGYGEVVEPFHLDTRKPLVIKIDDLPPFDTREDAIAWREARKAEGYDSLWVDGRHYGGTVHFVMFDPARVIRSEVAKPAAPVAEFYSLAAETPAELRARDAEAVAQAKRKMAEERALDRGPALKGDQVDLFSPQGSLFQSSENYRVSDPGGEDANRPRAPEGQLDLFAATAVPGSAAKTLERIVVEPEKVGEHRIGFNRINHAGRALSAFQALSRSPMEKFQALGLDANDKPIAFFDMFAGTVSQTAVYPREVWTAVYQTPGIKSVWIAHQHPSGYARPSRADEMLTRSLKAALTPDIGITLRGHLIVTKDAAVDIGPDGHESTPVMAPPAGARTYKLPIIERAIVKQDAPGQAIDSPAASRAFFKDFAPAEPGLLFLDAQNRPTTWLPMSIEAMRRLRTGDASTGMGGLMRDVGRSNAATAMAYTPEATTEASRMAFEMAVQNVGNALARADVKMLDAMTNEGGIIKSMAEKGASMASPGEFFQDQRQDPNLGSYKVAEHLITLFEGANKSTVVHELGHHFLETLKHFAMKPGAPARVTEMWEAARQEFAIPESGDIGRASHELNARSFERYLATGEAPSIALRGVFEKFRTWMLEIYKDIQNILGSKMNPEVKALFDKMLATDEEIAAARDLGVPREYLPAAAAEAAAQIVPPPEARRKIEPGFAAEQHSMQPFADELPRGPGEAPDNTHVNYAYINTPTDVKLAMQRMAEIDQANIQRQRGGEAGVKSWEQSNAEQAKYLNDILGGGPDTLKLLQPRDPNVAGVDVKLGVLKKLAVGAAKDSARLRDELLAAGHDATVRQQLEYMGSIERARMIQAEFLGERAGVARALNALKDSTEGTGEIARMLDEIGTGDQTLHQARTPEQEQSFMRAELDKIMERYRGKSPLDIAKLHKEIGTLKGTFKLAKAVTTATKWEMLVEGWRSGLLSGPVTHVTNLVGTEAFHVMRPMVDLVAGLIGIARGASIGMGETDRAAMSESVARLTGMLGGAADGVKVGYHEFMADNASMKTESHREAIPGLAGEVIRIPLRLMSAEDAMLQTMYRRGELHTLAIRQAFNESGNPNTSAFAERVRELVDKPTEEMVKAADDAAARMTFNMPLGEKGAMLTRAVRAAHLEWMVPFIRTPINIAKEMIRMTPLAPIVGEWRADFAKGGVARDRALAEVALGTALMTLTIAYAFNGNITGAGSPDAGKQRGKAGVEQPYSILIGDTWYEYARIQPMGTLMGMAADMANIWDHMTDEEKDKVPKMMAVAFSNAITNQTFLQGITNVVRTLEDPGRYGGNFIKQFAASAVPNVIGQPTTMADPYVREVNSALQAIQARLPILREQLAPKLDWLGQPVETKERVGLVLPIRTQEISDDKVRTEAARLEVSMAAPPKKTHLGKGTGKLGDVELTPEEKHKFQQVSGAMAHKILTPIVNGAGWDATPDLIKRRIYSRVLTASHQVAAVAALPMDKRQSYLQIISEKVQQELRPEEQQQ